MGIALDRPLSCPVVIGRGRALETVFWVIAALANGKGGVLLVSGEAGIGKSRLLREAEMHAGARGVPVVSGRCFEADRVVAYAPLVDLVRSLSQTSSAKALAEYLGVDRAHALAGVLPELNSQPPDGAEPPEFGRRRRTRAITALIAQQAQRQPLVAILEDIHWSDEASLDAIVQLARSAQDAPLLLLLTYRDDELNADLSRALAALDRERLASELHLRPLDQAEVAEMLRAILQLDRACRADLVDAVYKLTDGNPFFIDEVLRALLARGDLTYVEGELDSHGNRPAARPADSP
jgi:predicted ATPase